MRCYIGIGSNIGNRQNNLEKAAQEIRGLSLRNSFRASPVYETAALVSEFASPDWSQCYLNAVVQIEYEKSAHQLMHDLKKIENKLGRIQAPRWAPRIIDLDILLYGNEIIEELNLTVPHSGILNRSFVLDPLKDLISHMCFPGTQYPFVCLARKLKTRLPWIMGIINLTPDSFSDEGETFTQELIENKISRMDELGLNAIDIGAESTRPGATELTYKEEWLRLEPVIKFLKSRYQSHLIRPFISIDTRRAKVAENAIDLGVDCINDVSGLTDPDMLEVIRRSSCDYVLVHSLSVPANLQVTLPNSCDPVLELKKWLSKKIELLESQKINLNRIIFDPGIGFGKTPQQSLTILKRINEFSDFPVRLLVGHSRKSFMKIMGVTERKSKDAKTLEISLEIANQGVDILRVHDFESHVVAFKTRKENS